MREIQRSPYSSPHSASTESLQYLPTQCASTEHVTLLVCAVTRLQAFYRWRSCRFKYVEQMQAILKMQSFYRERLGGRDLNWQHAVLCFQRLFRGYLVRKKLLRAFDAARLIQASVRGTITRDEIRRQIDSTGLIQRAFRWRTCQLKYDKLRSRAAVNVQAFVTFKLGELYLTWLFAVLCMQRLLRGFLVRKRCETAREAACVLQANVRGVSARNAIRQQIVCAECIQRTYLQFRESNRRWEYAELRWRSTLVLQRFFRGKFAEWDVTRDAVVCLQRFIRGFLVRNNYEKEREAACLLQAVVRGIFTREVIRKQIECVELIQRTYCWKSSQFKITEIRKRAAVVKLQCIFRHKLEEQRAKRHQAVVSLQRVIRGFFARRKNERSFEGARVLQASVRGTLTRNGIRKQIACAVLVQKFYRWKSFQFKFAELKREVAAIKLQNFLRRELGGRCLKWRDAVVVIQHVLRGFLARRNCERARKAARLLQASVRGTVTRNSIRKQIDCAELIQRTYRGRLESARYLSILSSAFVLQTGVRRWLSRLHEQWQYAAEAAVAATAAAAVDIQQVYDVQDDMVPFAEDMVTLLDFPAGGTVYAPPEQSHAVSHTEMSLESAALMIQMWWKHRILKCGGAAATRIQRIYRGHRCASLYFITKRGFLQLQFLVRMHQQLNLKGIQQQYAAMLIQRLWRCYRQWTSAVVCIQKTWRGHRRAFTLGLEVMALCSVVLIQSLYRRNGVQRGYATLLKSVVCIQSVVRSVLARLVVCRMKAVAAGLGVGSAMLLRALYRRRLSLAQCSQLANNLIEAQSLVRCFLAKREVCRAKRMQSLCSVMLVQLFYRRNLGTTKYVHSLDSVVCTQKVVRSYLARKVAWRMKQQAKSRSCCMVLINPLCGQSAEHMDWARNVIHMQNLVRGFLATQDAGRMKKVARVLSLCSVVLMQSLYRHNLSEAEYRRYVRSVICIQTIVRSFLAKKEFTTRKKLAEELALCSAVLIQSLCRRRLLESKNARRNRGVVCLQSVVRGFLKKKVSVCEDVASRALFVTDNHERILASVVGPTMSHRTSQGHSASASLIQKIWKGRCKSTRLSRQTLQRSSAAILIQSFHRRNVAKQRVSQALWRLGQLQRSPRSIVEDVSYADDTSDADNATISEGEDKDLDQESLSCGFAAAVIQTSYRRKLAEVRYYRVLKSALRLQVIIRSFLATKEFCRMKHGLAASRSIELAWFSKQQGLLLVEREKAASTLQSSYPMNRDRVTSCRMENYVQLSQLRVSAPTEHRQLCEKQNAAQLIQTLWRRYFVNIRSSFSALSIQVAWREYMLRKSRLSLEATKIQAAYRRNRDYQKLMSLKVCMLQLQLIVRMHQNKDAKDWPHQEVMLLIKRTWTCWNAKKRWSSAYFLIKTAEKEHRRLLSCAQKTVARCRAVVTIQAISRGILARRNCAKRLKLVTKFQTACRKHLEYVRTREVASLDIQRCWVAFKERNRAKIWYAAATKISSTYRMHRDRWKFRCVVLGLSQFQLCQKEKQRKMRQIRLNSACAVQSVWREHQKQVALAKLHACTAVLVQSLYRGKVAKWDFLRVCRCVVDIQRIVRAYLARCKYLQIRKEVACSNTIQKSWRKHQKQVECRAHFAATRLQCNYRRMLCVRQFNNCKCCVLKLQLLIRTHQSNLKTKRHVAAWRIQAEWRMCMLRSSQQSSTMLIQKKWREHVDYVIHCEMELLLQRSAVVIQSFHLRNVERTKFLLAQSVCVDIQRYVRGCSARGELNEAKVACRIIQHSWVDYKRRECKRTKDDSATRIQCFYRCRWKYRQYASLRCCILRLQLVLRMQLLREKELHGVLQIQRSWRSWQSRTRCLNSACAIQSVWRAHQEQNALVKLQGFSALLVQSVYRSKVAKWKFSHLRRCVVDIQRIVKGYLARYKYLQMRCEAAGCITIQRAWRNRQEQMKCKAQFAATRIQCTYRRMLCVSQFNNCKCCVLQLQLLVRTHLRNLKTRRDVAAGRIQAEWRKCMLRSHQQSSTLLIQKVWREHVVHVMHREMELLLQRSAVVIQSFHLRNVERTKFLLAQGVCVDLQRYVRGCSARGELNEAKVACRIIQHSWVEYNCRKCERIRDDSATRIQCFYRCWWEYRNYASLRCCILRIQLVLRMRLLREKEVHGVLQIRRSWRSWQSKTRRFNSACAIQSVWRAHQEQNAFVKLQGFSAVLVQSVYRSKVAKCEFSHLCRCVVDIQRIVKGYLARYKYLQMRREVAGCNTIQRAWRNHQEQMKCKAQFAATRIQCTYRRMLCVSQFNNCKCCVSQLQRLARTHLRNVKTRRDVSAGRIQAKWRKCILRSRQQCSTMLIQKVWREHVVYVMHRETELLLQRSAVVIQSFHLRNVERTKFLLAQGVCVDLQRYVRGCSVIGELNEAKVACRIIQHSWVDYKRRDCKRTRDDSAVKMQCLYRCWWEYRKYARLRCCTLRLQLVSRMRLQREKELRGALQIQRSWRSWQSRTRCLNSACAIQSVWRRHQEQVALVKLHAFSAVLVQSLYRSMVAMRDFSHLCWCVVYVQKIVRGYLVRCKYIMRKEVSSCGVVQLPQFQAENFAGFECVGVLKFQARCRGNAARKRFFVVRICAIKIQKNLRSVFARHKIRRKVAAVRSIQLLYFSWQRERSVRRVLNSAIILQKVTRGYLSRSLSALRRKAAVLMQAWYRVVLVRQAVLQRSESFLTFSDSYTEYDSGTTNFSETDASADFSKHDDPWGYDEDSASTDLYQDDDDEDNFLSLSLLPFPEMQSSGVLHAKNIMLQERGSRLQPSFLGVPEMGNCSRSVMRDHVFPERTSEEVSTTVTEEMNECEDEESSDSDVSDSCDTTERSPAMFVSNVTRIQAKFRSFLLSSRYVRTVEQVVVLQSCFRCYIQVQHYKSAQDRLLFLQTLMRGFVTKRKYQNAKESAITLQSCIRTYFVVNAAWDRAQCAAIVSIQSVWRQWRAQSSYYVTKCYVVQVQSIVRRRQRRKVYQNVMYVVVMAQALYRCHLLRWRYRQKICSAIQIQSQAKCFLSWRKMVFAAITIQCFLRKCLCVHKLRSTTMKVIEVQSVVRRIIAGACMRRHRCATILIQRYWRVNMANMKKSKTECTAMVEKDMLELFLCRAQKDASVFVKVMENQRNASLPVDDSMKSILERLAVAKEKSESTSLTTSVDHEARMAAHEEKRLLSFVHARAQQEARCLLENLQDQESCSSAVPDDHGMNIILKNLSAAQTKCCSAARLYEAIDKM